MTNGGNLSLERWANFYVISSSAAATMVGLLFVVITLAADRRLSDAPKIRVYLTPVVIYFCSVLCLAALLTIPNQTPLTTAVCVCLGGVAGLGYSGSLAIRRAAGKGFYERSSDLFPYVIFPFAAYALIFAGGVTLLHRPEIGLDVVAAGMLTLLLVAIRNSWAIAITIVTSQA